MIHMEEMFHSVTIKDICNVHPPRRIEIVEAVVIVAFQIGCN